MKNKETAISKFTNYGDLINVSNKSENSKNKK